MPKLNSLSNADESIDYLESFVQRHARLFVLTGAGCSTESGIPDYRDVEGTWKHRQPIFYRDFVSSDQTRRRYWARSMLGWPQFARAEPNAAHHALVQLEGVGRVQQLVTQNVDGLHQKAGSRRVIDLHGRLDAVACMLCGEQSAREDLQTELQALNPGWSALQATQTPDGDADPGDLDLSGFSVPQCRTCGGNMKPQVVFFGENVPRASVETAFQRLSDSEAMLVVGSSLMVLSGYRFCRAAAEQSKPIVAITLGRTRADAELTAKIQAPCGRVLDDLVQKLALG